MALRSYFAMNNMTHFLQRTFSYCRELSRIQIFVFWSQRDEGQILWVFYDFFICELYHITEWDCLLKASSLMITSRSFISHSAQSSVLSLKTSINILSDKNLLGWKDVRKSSPKMFFVKSIAVSLVQETIESFFNFPIQ